MNKLWLAFWLGTFSLAQAHDTLSAGQVSLTISTDDEDDLGVNQPTTVFFGFDHQGKALPECHCRALLYAGQPSARTPPLSDLQLALTAGRSGQLKLSVPRAGQYTLIVVGRPARYGDFDAFKMQYALVATATQFDPSVWDLGKP
ncbi:hypothetical protein GCM10022631_17650 [Deinococcus rubellus]|uniref:hypothetical protein n=1 Tax=Deinococcus rubellus TaxID=1889240 RepID=UPI0031E82890